MRKLVIQLNCKTVHKLVFTIIHFILTKLVRIKKAKKVAILYLLGLFSMLLLSI